MQDILIKKKERDKAKRKDKSNKEGVRERNECKRGKDGANWR